MRKIVLLAFLFLLSLANISFSQDTLLLVNGKRIVCGVKEVNENHKLIFYELSGKRRPKYKFIDFSEVYMINYHFGTKQNIYRQDSMRGFNLSFYEVGKFIEGEQFAMKNYKAPWVTVGGAAVGAVTPVALPVLYGLGASLGYVGVFAIVKPSKKKYEEKYPELFQDKAFKNGFVIEARKKRIMNSIYGSLIGFGVAAITTGIIYAVDKK
jgi:hypothetical protein